MDKKIINNLSSDAKHFFLMFFLYTASRAAYMDRLEPICKCIWIDLNRNLNVDV